MPQIQGTPPQVCNCHELVEQLRQKRISTAQNRKSSSGIAKPHARKTQSSSIQQQKPLGKEDIQYASDLVDVKSLDNMRPKPPAVTYKYHEVANFTIHCNGNTYAFSTPAVGHQDIEKLDYKSLSLEVFKPDNSRTHIIFSKQKGRPTSITIDEYENRTTKTPRQSYVSTDPGEIKRIEQSLVNPTYRYVQANPESVR